MSCWRVLSLSEQADGKPIPQLLIKPAFSLDSYAVHLTDLSNIWSEELALDDIVDRASQEQSPIEVSKQDPTQLAILLENVAKPFNNADGAMCRMTRNGDDCITLHASIALPEPLGHLTWKFHLQKRTSTVLKNEFILPLLVSSHVQNERITSLIQTINSKDKAINRLLDQFDSYNLDLSAAFPSVGGMRAGRRMLTREQAAKRVPALQPFHESAWRRDTAQLKDSELTSLGLFQEALAKSTPKVPEQLKSEKLGASWWTSVPTKLIAPKAPVRDTEEPALPLKPGDVSESTEEETEDEFDTHENFKTRNFATKSADPMTTRRQQFSDGHEKDKSDSTEDEVDLDAPLGSQIQHQVPNASQPLRQKSMSPIPSSPPRAAASSSGKATTGGFRIGGRPGRASPSPPSVRGDLDARSKPDDVLITRESVPPSQTQPGIPVTPKKARKLFKIGGKGKAIDADPSQRATTASPSKNRIRTRSPTAGPPSSPPLTKEVTPVQEVVEETPEEKAERRRTELKRRNEEAAKKLAQQKKKKRF
ncbi:hypothetical protein yc1106_03561 [Curvularia clavata]|uniref:Non-homologous end-joining factor 1 n=1 Tax=Curvularia clavata TaxID=95742 RepID=A0A9Q8Z4S2_CURCL|nr:hypothetical protein yc1106_03561 [Curvularia clavata]